MKFLDILERALSFKHPRVFSQSYSRTTDEANVMMFVRSHLTEQIVPFFVMFFFIDLDLFVTLPKMDLGPEGSDEFCNL